MIKKYKMYIYDNRLTSSFLMVKLTLKWLLHKNNRNQKKNKLPSTLIISLTSYRKRFPTLHLTIKSLLLQTVKPDKLILWISYEDKYYLPEKVIKLKKYGLIIKYYQDIKSYKKIIPTILLNNKAFIATTDDDVYYWSTWLYELVSNYNYEKKEIIAHRVRLVKLNKNQQPEPYNKWKLRNRNSVSNFNFFTGNGGVLYPPLTFINEATNHSNFMSLCPTADDIWLNWMIRLNGFTVKKIGSNRKVYSWPFSQSTSLTELNVLQNKNDKQISKMIHKYGNIFT